MQHDDRSKWENSKDPLHHGKRDGEKEDGVPAQMGRLQKPVRQLLNPFVQMIRSPFPKNYYV